MRTTPDAVVERGLASFDSDWSPLAYLAEYYTEVQHDEEVTMRFLAEAAAHVGEVETLLEFGCGPTVHHLFPFATLAETIHVADYLQCNLDAVRCWVAGEVDAWDWAAFAACAVGNELGRVPTPGDVAEREASTRRRIRAFHRGDARCLVPLAANAARFPAVLCCFCPDSITDDLDEWRRCTENIASLVAPGGWLVLTALGHAASYRVGALSFPSAGVSEHHIAEVLHSSGFARKDTTITTADAAGSAEHGFDSVLLAISRRG